MRKVEFQELKNIVFQIYGFKNINEDTIINYEKTISEDNDKFINMLKLKYNVNMDNFNYYDYFEEDEFIIINILRSFLSLLGFRKKKKKKLKLKHVLKAINNGKWI